MFISIHEVPRYERHLLFCSDSRLEHEDPGDDESAAVNRTLAIHGESVDRLSAMPPRLLALASRPAVGVA